MYYFNIVRLFLKCENLKTTIFVGQREYQYYCQINPHRDIIQEIETQKHLPKGNMAWN